jgi:hypothetical protein
MLDPISPSPGQQGGRDDNYAHKQWAGIVKDAYAACVSQFLALALEGAAAGRAIEKCPAMAQRTRLQPLRDRQLQARYAALDANSRRTYATA